MERCATKGVFEAHKSGDLIDPDTGELYILAFCFLSLKPVMRQFFKTLQGLTKIEMGKAATHMPTAKWYWMHPRIVFTKLKTFNPPCYIMKEWAGI